MYTQVAFGDFLYRLIQQTGIEFKEYPNVAISWNEAKFNGRIL
jgi:hypothetical protein